MRAAPVTSVQCAFGRLMGGSAERPGILSHQSKSNGNQNFPKGEFHVLKFSCVTLITEDPKNQESSWQKTK